MKQTVVRYNSDDLAKVTVTHSYPGARMKLTVDQDGHIAMDCSRELLSEALAAIGKEHAEGRVPIFVSTISDEKDAQFFAYDGCVVLALVEKEACEAFEVAKRLRNSARVFVIQSPFKRPGPCVVHELLAAVAHHLLRLIDTEDGKPGFVLADDDVEPFFLVQPYQRVKRARKQPVKEETEPQKLPTVDMLGRMVCDPT